MDVKMTVYNESRPGWGYWRDDRGVSVRNGFFFFDKARSRGDVLRFVAEGPDAKEAMEVITDLLENPTDVGETAKWGMRYMFGGRKKR